MTVIVVSFIESVVEDHSKDHAVAVAYFTATRSPGAVHHSAGRNCDTWHNVCRELQRLRVGYIDGAAGTYRQTTETTPQRRILTRLNLTAPPHILQLDVPAG